MKESRLERDWNDLMSLCNRETDFKNGSKHPKLLRYISDQVEERARGMGFNDRQIRSREFRAEREDGRITRLLTE